MMTKQEAGELVAATRFEKGTTWAALAERLGTPLVWTTSALLGQHPLSAEQARTVCDELGLGDDVALALQMFPTRGSGHQEIPTDPTIYRLYEALSVYGPALKELIHEEFGDGIMSAINFNMDIERRECAEGDRVHITLDGKFLPYAW